MKVNKIVILPLLILVVLVIGTSYAFYTKTSETNRQISLTTGNKYVGVYGDNKDSIELNKDYTFTIENRGTVDAGYELYLESTTDLDLSKINYIISGDVTKTGTLSDNIFNTGNIATGQTITITLRLELDSAELARINSENATRTTNNQELISLDYTGKIRVNTINPTYLKDVVSLGDIVRMTPTQTSYTIDPTLTGMSEYSRTTTNPQVTIKTEGQTINPSLMKYWRVININDNGTIELVSEYAQLDLNEYPIYLYGATGFQKYIGTLNTIASQYYNDSYTVNTHSAPYFREIGYNGQTVYLSSPPTLELSGTTSTPRLLYTETVGEEYNGGYGGDTKCARDLSLVRAAYIAKNSDLNNDTSLKIYQLDKVGNPSTKYATYYLASRSFMYSSGSYYFWGYSSITINGAMGKNSLISNRGSFERYYSIRPIITLKANIFKPSGDGQSIETAWNLQ